MRKMSAAREELQEALCQYMKDTLSYIYTLKEFSERLPEWIDSMDTELRKMTYIKDRGDKINMSFGYITKHFSEYIRSKLTLKSDSCKREELEKELAAVLKDTLGGLEKLDCFLDAVEKLAVTSLHLFKENQVLNLPQEISPHTVQVCIIAAQLVCPLLLEFKRDGNIFFLPRLQNVEVLAYQLGKYVQTTQKICDKFKKSCFSEFSLKIAMNTVVDLDVNLPEDEIRRMLSHINQLEEIRMDQHFRMVFLFKEKSCCDFISEFSERQPRMLKFLSDLEDSAVQLDRMNTGAKASSVAGSSVGAIGGILSIVGLALIPVTAGVSLALTMAGVGLGITSGVNSAVTTVTEIGVNRKHQRKANEAFQCFMEDVQHLQNCLERVSSQTESIKEASKIDVFVGVRKVATSVGGVGKSIDSLVDAASAFKLLKNEELIASAGKVVAQEGKALRNVPRVASDIPDIGQAALKGPLALTNSARAGFIALNALFLGMDIFFVCKDSISLAKGSKTEVSQFIRARAALWHSEMHSWQKIRSSLCQGRLTSQKKQAVLETPFEPEMEIKINKVHTP
ncbi:uncharacterized protein LOC122986704 isoform X2 [Thunnus albacares]|uniref:uncharacterized protein LOC122986704 isoform X2 n=1 Tax=Thunnus albacares TaxID=8236 RepID=UPI001CF63D3C|nr:uncharacterized protein LOC122986704 isoform X2 [Thunnus albacares]